MKTLKNSMEIYDRQAEICGALASPVRLQILDLLSEGERTATDLMAHMEVPKSNLSQHLNVLKRAGILKVRSKGRFQYLALAMPEIKQACALVRKVLAAQMNQEAAMAKSYSAELRRRI